MTRDHHRPLREAWIVEAVRTPIGRYGGALATVRPDDLAALVLRAVVDRAGVDPALVEDVILGCANQAGEDNRDVARMALLLAGFPVEVGGLTVNRLCGSGLQAINSAAHAIAVGDGDVFIGGGVESMTRAPYVQLKAEGAWDRGAARTRRHDPRLAVREPEARRAALPVFDGRDGRERRRALGGQPRAPGCVRPARASSGPSPPSRPAGSTTRSCPVRSRGRKGEVTVVARDEHPRADTTAEALARLKPAFKREGGSVTAGNSSGINDGASAVLVVEAERARDARPAPARPGRGDGGRRRRSGGHGRRARSRRRARRWSGPGSRVDDLDLVELNEAFASQSLVCIDELGLDPARVNVNGGAIALGHPLGMSGGRLVTMLTHELRRTGGRYGLATMCIGVGQGIATVVERIEG